MAKIPLTIDPSYCRDWGFWEGARELIQNAKDADEFEGLKMTVQHSSRSCKLAISTDGISLPAATLLLLGASSKRGAGQRGQFGEGFALGCLALVREGFPVTIYNGDEVMRPAIEKAEDGAFAGQELLVFTTRKLQNTRSDFSVEVENVSKPVWEATEKLFLFLAPSPAKETVELPNGDKVLLSEAYKSMLFCRGIFVTKVEDLECGYDLQTLPLDRDRKVIEEWDLRWRLADVWKAAHDLAPTKFAPKIYEMAKKESAEVKNLSYRADAKLIAALHEEFEKEHGQGAVPVGTMQESRDLEKLGAKTVVVDRTLRELLEKSGASVSAAKQKLQGTITTRHGWSALTLDEQKSLEWVERVTKDYVIVDFNDEATNCRWVADENKIAVARKLLTSEPRELLRSVAVHVGTQRGVSTEIVLLDVIFGQPA